MKVEKPTYEELLKKVKEQEIEINNLNKSKSDSIKDYSDFLIGNETLRDTFDRITDSFVAFDNNDCYVYMNRKCGEFINRNPDEMIGKHIWTEFPETKNELFYQAYQKAKKTQQYTFIDEYYPPYNVWIEGNIYPSDNGISIFFRDVTEKKKASLKILENEKKFRALVENNDGLITVIDENLKIIFRSSSSERVTGWTNEEFESINNIDYYHPDQINYLNDKKLEALKNPGKIIPITLYVKHKKGHYLCLEGTVVNLLNDNNVNGFVFNLKDVTKTKKILETLIEEREKFEKISQTSPGLIYSIRKNLDGTLSFPYASKATEQIYGLTLEEYQNSSYKISELIHPEDLDYVKKSFANTVTNLVPLNCEYRYFHPIKGLVCHEINSLPVLEPEGSVICHGIITDVTERIEAKQKLIKANHLYLFISQLNQLIVRTTDDLSLFKEVSNLAINLGDFKMTWIGLINENSKTVEQIVIAGEGKDYVHKITPIKIDKELKSLGPIQTAILTDNSIISNDIENDILMIPCKEDSMKFGYLSMMVLPIKKFGKIIGVFVLYSGEKNYFDSEEIKLLQVANKDISFALENIERERLRKIAEEKVIESEKRYQSLTEVSPVGIFRTDINGDTTYVNKKWSKITGLSFKEAMGKGWINALHDDDKRQLISEWNNIVVRNKITSSEYRFVQPDGSTIWVIGNAIPEKNINDEVIGYVGTVTDITERVKLGIEISKAKELAETANRYKSEFLANMSHEIRTPLNGIIGFTQLLMNSNLEENQLEFMNTINESATSLMQIVNDVLDFSEIESGKLELIIDKIDVYEIAQQTINLFKYQSSQKDLNLILNIDKEVSQYIYGDGVRLKQVLVNLLSNAIKFTSLGEVRLDITGILSDDDKYATINFSVKDTGIGIKSSNHKNIFNSFVQEDNSTKRKFGGTGLGLAISNQLLALMNSKLELESEKGIGSNFFFTIKGKKTKLLNSETKVIQDENLFKIFSKKRILIVEDNKINMFLIKTLVKKIVPNAILVEAYDGNEAITEFEKNYFDIILIDVQMPHKNGYEVTEHIRKLKKGEKIPIIAITAGILQEEKEKCFISGMNDYLAKPIIYSDLEQIIYKWLQD